MWPKEQIKRVLMHRAKTNDVRRRRALAMTDHDLRPEQWDAAVSERGHLTLGGCDAVDVAERFGTPLQVVDLNRLRSNFQRFRNAFTYHYPKVDVGYSYKTNPLPAAIFALHKIGAWAEVISHFELWLALELGVSPANIVVNGPGKNRQMLELAVSKHARIINVDNIDELEVLQQLCIKHDTTQDIGVRVVTSVGWSSQFGLSIRDGAARSSFELARRNGRLNPRALHIHLGTGIRDVAIYLQAVREVLEFASTLKRDFGIAIDFFDFGGGFGVPTVKQYSSMDRWLMANEDPPMAIDVRDHPPIERYAEHISALVREYCPASASDGPALFFEPGRAVTSSAQTLLLQVVAVKKGNGKASSLILNGGVNVAMPLLWEYHEILAAGRLNDAHDWVYRVCGPLCHPGDVLAAAKRLPTLYAGDVVAVMDAGAYFVPNQMNFSNPRPAAITVEDGVAELVREHEPFAHIVSLDRNVSR